MVAEGCMRNGAQGFHDEHFLLALSLPLVFPPLQSTKTREKKKQEKKKKKKPKHQALASNAGNSLHFNIWDGALQGHHHFLDTNKGCALFNEFTMMHGNSIWRAWFRGQFLSLERGGELILYLSYFLLSSDENDQGLRKEKCGSEGHMFRREASSLDDTNGVSVSGNS